MDFLAEQDSTVGVRYGGTVMIDDRYRRGEPFAVEEDDLEADLAKLLVAFRSMAHPVSLSSGETGPADGRDGAEQRRDAHRPPAVLPSRHGG